MGTWHDDEHRFDADVLVIGAGAAGLAAGKVLLERGLRVDWVEHSDHLGGLWDITDPDSAAYQTLRTNSSRDMTAFRSFPMPAEWPDFPTHEQMLEYLGAFADEFGLRDAIRFEVTVTAIEPVPGPGLPGENGWAVTSADDECRYVQHVVVATGHHRAPYRPEIPGTFDGIVLHAHDYRSPDLFIGKRVVVVGGGNSGTDIATDAARRADFTALVVRGELKVLPRYLLGRPIDRLRPGVANLLPAAVERSLFDRFVARSTATDLGAELDAEPPDDDAPTPDTATGDEPLHSAPAAGAPPVAPDLPELLATQDVVIKPGIAGFARSLVEFTDGTAEVADVVVLATGYRVDVPFLGPEVLTGTDRRLPLFQHVVAPQRPGLWFVGFVDAVGANIPLFERQAEWVADAITDKCVLPGRTTMRRWIDRQQQSAGDAGSALLVDRWRYEKALQAERARRRQRPKLSQRLRSAVTR